MRAAETGPISPATATGSPDRGFAAAGGVEFCDRGTAITAAKSSRLKNGFTSVLGTPALILGLTLVVVSAVVSASIASNSRGRSERQSEWESKTYSPILPPGVRALRALFD